VVVALRGLGVAFLIAGLFARFAAAELLADRPQAGASLKVMPVWLIGVLMVVFGVVILASR
jgi:hypothetical protein